MTSCFRAPWKLTYLLTYLIRITDCTHLPQ